MWKSISEPNCKNIKLLQWTKVFNKNFDTVNITSFVILKLINDRCTVIPLLSWYAENQIHSMSLNIVILLRPISLTNYGTDEFVTVPCTTNSRIVLDSLLKTIEEKHVFVRIPIWTLEVAKHLINSWGIFYMPLAKYTKFMEFSDKCALLCWHCLLRRILSDFHLTLHGSRRYSRCSVNLPSDE